MPTNPQDSENKKPRGRKPKQKKIDITPEIPDKYKNKTEEKNETKTPQAQAKKKMTYIEALNIWRKDNP